MKCYIFVDFFKIIVRNSLDIKNVKITLTFCNKTVNRWIRYCFATKYATYLWVDSYNVWKNKKIAVIKLKITAICYKNGGAEGNRTTVGAPPKTLMNRWRLLKLYKMMGGKIVLNVHQKTAINRYQK